MPHLGDYLGQLLSEITIARMQADIEAVRIAELYASHELLRHMPVPHFRLPNVEIDVPVVVSEVENEKTSSPTRGTPAISDMRKTFDYVLDKLLQRHHMALSARDRQRLNTILDAKIEFLVRPDAISIDVKSVADALANEASRFLGGLKLGKEPNQWTKVEADFKSATRVAFLNLRKPPPRLSVRATTPEVREGGGPEVITKIHMTLSEDSFEWTTVESEGRQADRLVPE